MLRTLLKIAAGFLLLMLLLLGALAIALPRFVQTEEFQSALRSRATKALGVGVEWDHAEVGFLPPRMILDSLVLRGDVEADEADEASEGANDGASEVTRLRAASVDLRVELMPLLSRRVEVGSLAFRGVDLVVTRTDAGWIWPIQLGAGADGSGNDGDGSAENEASKSGSGSREGDVEGAADGSAFSLTFGRVQLDDAAILIRDRTLSRVIDWQLSELDFEVTEAAGPGRYWVEFESSLAADAAPMGRMEGQGEIARGASAEDESGLGFDVDVELDGAELEKLVSYLPVQSAKGRLSGSLGFLGAASQIQEVQADLRAEMLVTQIAGLDIAGSMSIEGVQRPAATSDFKVGVDLDSGGHVEVEGTRAKDGALEATSRLEQVDLLAAASMLGSERKISGTLTGDLVWASRGNGSFSALKTDLRAETFGYSDQTHRLENGALAVAVEFQEKGPREGAERYVFSGTFDGSGRMPEGGSRAVEGLLDAKLVLTQADLAALPFGLSIAALPVGALTGGVDLRGNLESRFASANAGSGPGAGQAAGNAAARVLSGDLEWAAKTGAKGAVDLDAGLNFKDGGSVNVKGSVTHEGVLDVATQIRTLDLKMLSPFLSFDDVQLGGILSGPGRLRGPAASPSRFELDAKVSDGELIAGEYQVAGPYAAKLDIKNPFSPQRTGEADLDLTNARVLYEGRFEKKAGVPALLDAKFAPNASGETEFESRLKLKNLERIQIQGALGEIKAVSMTATSLDLGQVAEFIPALVAYRASGRVSLSDFAIVQAPSVPTQFKGKLVLGDVALTLPDAGRVGLAGAIFGDGNRLRTEALQITAGDVKIELEGHLEDPLGEGRFSFSGRTVGAPDVNSLLSALTSKRDTVFGPLRLEGDVSGATSGAAGLVETMIGTLRFSVGEEVGGRLRGVSLLKAVLDQIPLFGSAILSKPFRGGRSVEDFFSDKFEIIEGEFAIRQGAVEAKKLRLAYQGYEANLSGLMQLRDLSLDMTGELLLQSDLIAVLVGTLGRDGTDRDPIRIPLARVSNTLSEPKVSMTPRTLVVIPKVLIQATGLDRLKEGLEAGLGKILNPTLPLMGGNK